MTSQAARRRRTAATVSCPAAHGRPTDHHIRHRASRVPRPRRGRGARRRGGEAHRAGRPVARALDPRARLPRRQGAGARRHQARRPRGRARRGGPRLDRRLVLRRHRRRRDRPGRRAGARSRRAARRRPAAARSRSRSASARRPRSATTRGSRSSKGDAAASDEAVEAEVERLRERSGRLETVEREAGDGDFVVMDYAGTLDGEAFAGGEGRDQMIELGSGRLVPGFEEQLTGAKAGDERTVQVTFPDDYGAAELAGQEAEFAVTVKEVKAKELPELDDDLAAEAGLRHARRAARRHPRAALRGRGGPGRGRVPRGGARRRGRERHRRGPRGARRGTVPRALGPDAPLPLAPGDQQGDVPPDLRPQRGGDRRRGQGRRGAPAQARGRARRGRRRPSRSSRPRTRS